MNRTVILLLLFCLLGGGTYYLMNQDPNSTTSNKKYADFAVENIDEVQKIFIAERTGRTATLTRHNDHWMYNGTHKVNPNIMMRLLETIEEVDMYYTTPRAAEKNMLSNLATHGVKVEIYGKENKKLKSYYVGGSTADGYGTFMIMEGSKEPYITHIPGFEGTIRLRYVKKEDDWKDKTIFAESVDDIEKISVEYPKRKNKSFKIERKGNSYEVNPFYDVTPKSGKPVQKPNVEKYLLGYKQLVAEAYENTNPRRDSIVQHVPFVSVSMTNKSGETMTANFHPLILRDVNGRAINTEGNVERYFINCSDGSFRLGQHRVFGKIFYEYDYFFRQ